MSVESARERKKALLDAGMYQDGYCLPLALDSVMRKTALPEKYYKFFFDSFVSRQSYNSSISHLLKDFFRVEVTPPTQTANIAKYNFYGESHQQYVPTIQEVGSNRVDQILLSRGVTQKQLKLRNTLWAAASVGCNVLFSVPTTDGNEHVEGLEMIDPGMEPNDARFVVRSLVEIRGDRVYAAGDLAGIGQVLTNSVDNDKYSPLPELSRPSFGEGNTSWELIILPPEPR